MKTVTVMQKGKPVTFDLYENGNGGSVIAGPWHVGTKPNGIYWYIVDVDNHTVKKIGSARSTGVNYYDKAVEEANKRNKLIAGFVEQEQREENSGRSEEWLRSNSFE